ncbi:MAG: hypothetical protein E7368_03390 [Clostridiales bacterium]|nr:hypothetical protein [Clostridiales bacterium]
MKKAKFMKFLRQVGYIVPFLVGLIEKLALGLSKKLAGLATRARNYLDRVKQVCDCELEEVFPDFCQ